MSNECALLIASVCLFSTGHWIGGSVLLIYFIRGQYAAYNDPFGLERLRAALRRGV